MDHLDILLLALAILGWGYALALACELGKARKALTQATKNDHRDPETGRFVKA